MIDPAVFICEPIHFQNICKVYPPTIRQVVSIPLYSVYQKTLTLSQDDIIAENKKQGITDTPLTPLEFLLNCAYNNKDFKRIAEEAFLLFIHEPVTFSFEDKKIIVGDMSTEVLKIKNLSELRIINEDNYFAFQNAIRLSLDLPEEKPPEPDDPDEDPRVTEIKRRARERDRIKAHQKNKDGIFLSTCMAAICCMGIGITPLNIGELSYGSINTIMNMMQEKEKYDLDVRSLLAGADSKKIKPKYWIRNKE